VRSCREDCFEEIILALPRVPLEEVLGGVVGRLAVDPPIRIFDDCELP
jgi:hypothetical protein